MFDTVRHNFHEKEGAAHLLLLFLYKSEEDICESLAHNLRKPRARTPRAAAAAAAAHRT